MTRRVTGIWWSPATEGTPALVVTAAFFTLGGLTGFFLAFRMADTGTETMTAYLNHFLTTAQAGGLTVPALPELLWRTLRWPLAAILLGFSTVGLLGIPILSCMRGFFLAFSVASFAVAYGHSGLTVAFFLLGLPGLLAIPAFLVLATQSFSAACALTGKSGRRESPLSRDFLFRCGLCAMAVCVGILLERYLVPALVSGTAGSLLR